MADNDHNNREEEGGEDEEEELDEGGYKTVKDAVLFAIEVSSSMLKPPKKPTKGDTDSPAAAALKCAFHLMQQRIISSPKDMIGILLYGTEQTRFPEEDNSRGSFSYPHCYLLTDLNIPDAGDVKTLKKLVEDEKEASKLLVPSEEPVSMANVLFCANQLFTTRAPNFSSRRLFIVTDNDNPHALDKALRSSAIVRAKDLYDLGVTIELFPISTLDHEFDRSKFYEDIIYSAVPSDPDAPAYYIRPETSKVSSGDGISLLNSLLSEINSKSVAWRALFSNMSLEIGPGFKISVKGYILFKQQEIAKSTYVWTHGEKAQLAKLVSSRMATDTARVVEKWEVKKAVRFGGEQIVFTPEEILELRNFGGPGIRIIGFKPLSKLPLWASTKRSTFIYPSEEDYVGSTRVFSALQQKLLKDQKMAITLFVPRRNAIPRIAALIPGEEKLGDGGEQVMPPGLWVIELPYADDIRQKPEMSHITAPDELIDKMRPVIQNLQLPKAQYNPLKYPNPALQWHYRVLQALALDEDLPEKPEDKTIPKYKQIEKRVGGKIAEWKEELEKQHLLVNKDFHTTKTLAKRPAPSASNGAPTKKAKVEPNGLNSESNDADMKRLVEDVNVNQLKLPELKLWLKSKGLDLNGKKADLVERVEAYFENW